jgi:subtilisin family serine protease
MRRILAIIFCSALAGCAATRVAQRAPPLPADMQSEPSKFVVVTVRNDPRPLATRAGATLRGYDSAGLYGVTSDARAAVRELTREYGLREVSAWPIAALRVHCIVFRVPENTAPVQMIARLAHDPRVDSAQPLNQFATEGQVGDSGYESGYNDPYSGLQTVLSDLTVAQAQHWSRGTGVRIAIIDTGVDFEHPDLAGQIIARRNFVDVDEHSFRRDRHGTAVAGVIAAVADNHIGIVGIAPDARLLALKACWQLGPTAGAAVCDSFTLAQALESAIDLQADVVNLSLAGPTDPLLARLLRRGMQRGIVFVGAAPPAGRRGGFPTDVDGVIAVAAAEDPAGEGKHLLAPGHEILTLVPDGHWDFASGSSIAAAEVTATVALLLAGRPHMAPTELYRVLALTSRSLTTHGAPLVSVNACAALAEVLQREGCEPGRSSVASSEGASAALPARLRTHANTSN